jgi:glycosyltransferase involved in cell wall biosynthesis
MNLGLFFTRGISLRQWVETGLFQREKLIYEQHLVKGNFDKIIWFTYGTNDLEYLTGKKKLCKLNKQIVVVPMPKLFNIKKIGPILYSFLLPFIKKRYIKKCDVLKTNQIDGCWSAVIARCLFKKPLVLRAGYIPSQSKIQKRSFTVKIHLAFKLVEKLAYTKCDVAIVSNSNDKKYIEKNYAISPHKVKVIYNYIDTNIFKTLDSEKFKKCLVYIGRLSPEKNLYNLIKAVSESEFSLHIYGDGTLRKDIEKFARKQGASVKFMNIVPNDQLPVVLNRYRYFILPSYFEGMPKALLEAMACGLVCIATNVHGINEIIEDGVDGFLIDGTDSFSIQKTIARAKDSRDRSVPLRAIYKIKRKFCIEKIVLEEKLVFEILSIT